MIIIPKIMTEQMASKLRDKIRESGLSANKLWKLTGVSQPTITEFLRGSSMSLANAQKLADHFGLVLTEDKKRSK